MGAYILRRILLIPPTLLIVMAINFIAVQFIPGGPIEQILSQLDHPSISATTRVTGGAGDFTITDQGKTSPGGDGSYRGSRGLDPAYIAELERQFGFDKPPLARFLFMMGRFLRFDFGKSYFQDRAVVDLVIEKLPVSVSLGLVATLLIYWISIPLGVAKAIGDGSRFDVASSAVIITGAAIPSFLFALLLVILFAGGQYFDWFPLRGLVSDGHEDLSWSGRLADRLHHLVLPVTALVIGGFAGLTMLTKNSFLDEINKLYVMTARAKGLSTRRVLWRHVFRNAMLIVIAGFPAALIGILFTGALLIEIIFSLDGLGLLSFEAAINRDYPIMFATLFVFTLIGLVMGIVNDLAYVVVDPRIDFERSKN